MKRPAFWIVFFTICGIYFRLGKSEMVCLVFFVLDLFFIFWVFRKKLSCKYLFFLLFIVLGFLRTDISLSKETTDKMFTGMTEGNGIITDVGITSSGNQKLTIISELSDGEHEAEDVKLYAVWTGEERFSAGDIVKFTGETESFYEASVPGGYDENMYLQTKGYDGKMYPDEITYLGEDASLSSVIAKGRMKVHETLESILPANESGIMKAMLTGDKDDIPDETYDLYAKTGIVHILCISGLHMSVLALYVSIFMERILKCSRRISAVVTMLASLAFLMFIGFTPSAVRAVTMICVVMAARVLFRIHDRLNEISIAALLILMIEPLYLFHIGFQLSFITVLGLCIAAEKKEDIRRNEHTWKDTVRESLRFSLYASLFSFPMVAYYFYYLPLVGIFANLLVLPLSGLLLGFGILSAVSGMFCLPIGVFAAGSVYWILQLFETACKLLLKLPFAYILTGSPSETVIILCYGLLLCWLYFGERKGSWKAAVILCAALWCAVFGNRLFYKETTVTFLDVGQGDAAVVHTWDGKTYLVDGGGVYGKDFGKNVGKTILLPHLEYLGVKEIDAAFLSHPDSDHMTGLLELLGNISIKELYIAEYPYKVTKELEFLKEMLEKYPFVLYTVDNRSGSSDDSWKCLSPVFGTGFSDGEDNHGSMVLKYEYGGTKVLFTGDMTAENEYILMENGTDISADILKVSHHGSKYSSQERFLTETGADAAIISCGKENIFGHPHIETLERLNDADMDIYRTDTDGSILVKIRGDGTYRIETMAERMPLYERIKKTMEEW